MENITLIHGQDPSQALEDFLCEFTAGLKGARDRGVMVRMPEFLDLQITYIHALSVATIQKSSQTPAVTETSESTAGAQESTSTRNEGSRTTTSTPPGQRTEHRSSGSDISRTTYEYEG